jgi:alkylation response protein AidB-like acyl-CoA dehydrogenase
MRLTPTAFLELFDIKLSEKILEYENWFFDEGLKISESVDRKRTVHLRMFDRFGNRVDELLYSPEYYRMLYKAYKMGIIANAFEEKSLKFFYTLGYVISFFDTGLYCPYTVSMASAMSLYKYADEKLKEEYFAKMIKKGNDVWQGATWMTEVNGGSDLANNVETIAEYKKEKWQLNGEKYFSSNVGAELAIVAARVKDKPKNVKSLSLFLVPRYRKDGTLNYFIRRIKDKIGTRSVPTGEVELKDSEGYLIGKEEWGIYLILEALNISRVANSIGSVALAQRAIYEAQKFASRRVAFGKNVIEHPLLKRQFEERSSQLLKAFALSWECVLMLDEVIHQKPPYSERYFLFRLLTHLAKFWTAEIAVQNCKWAMEVNGGMGVLEEYGVERLLREAMILPIWEGTPHRQVLDALEVILKKDGHKLLYSHLESIDPKALEIYEIGERLKQISPEESEKYADLYMNEICQLTAEILVKKYRIIF